MKKILIALLFFTVSAFAEQFVLDNQTSYPAKNQKIAIQWAQSAQEVDVSNKSLMHDADFTPDQLQVLKQKGKNTLTIPNNANYFRIVAWSNGEDSPDFTTNWIDVVPGKTYILKTDHL